MVMKANKRKRDEDKETTFLYGDRRWTKHQAEASCSRMKKGEGDSDPIGEQTVQPFPRVGFVSNGFRY